MEASEEFGSIHRDALYSRGCRDEHHAQETFDSAVLSLAGRPDIRDYTVALSAALRNKRLEVYRGSVRRRKRIAGYLDDRLRNELGDEVPRFEIPLDKQESSAESVALSKMAEKKDAEKRQLLDILVDRANDPVATQIATKNDEFDGDKFSVNALAKALGIHHQVLSRKLTTLSRHYDPIKDGEILEYLPQGLRVKSSYLTA